MAKYRGIEPNIRILKTNKNTKRYFKTIKYPNIPETNDDIYVITDVTDRLDNLAFQFYKNTSYWIYIALANPDNLRKDSYFVNPGIQLRIPANIEGIVSKFRDLNR